MTLDEHGGVINNMVQHKIPLTVQKVLVTKSCLESAERRVATLQKKLSEQISMLNKDDLLIYGRLTSAR